MQLETVADPIVMIGDLGGIGAYQPQPQSADFRHEVIVHGRTGDDLLLAKVDPGFLQERVEAQCASLMKRFYPDDMDARAAVDRLSAAG